MGIEISTRLNFGKLQRLLKRDVSRDLQRGLDVVRVQIVQRTQAGKTVTGRKFKPYSAAYARKKRVSRGAVDLTLSGIMLGAVGTQIRIEGNRIVGRLFFRGGGGRPTAARKARIHHEGLGKMPKRPFFGLSQKQQRLLRKYIRGEI